MSSIPGDRVELVTDATASTTTLQRPQSDKLPTVLVTVGMAGSGKTTFIQRLVSHLLAESKKKLKSDGEPVDKTKLRAPYVINLDPAVGELPYNRNIDIRDTIDYKKVMKDYKLGPNGAISTSLNMFATDMKQVIDLVQKRKDSFDYVIVDTPGQIEVFTWSAAGTLITDVLAASFPTVMVYVVDTPRTTSPVTFMSNMLYACSILYKTRIPFVVAFNKIDIASHQFALDWMADFEKFQEAIRDDESYMSSLMSSMCLVLDEFYNCLRTAGVSAMTGQGYGEFMEKVKEAVHEYDTEYWPELERIVREKDARMAERKLGEIDRMMEDMKVSATTSSMRSNQSGLSNRDILMRDDIDDDENDNEDMHNRDYDEDVEDAEDHI
ncbi:hypothetical protein GQ42DRAFT_148713 [Ramicandelaber brevisporus]|nr:hypothetical protein GQ42DRAFT_148713 [Ramicandelaber brevisporus]